MHIGHVVPRPRGLAPDVAISIIGLTCSVLLAAHCLLRRDLKNSEDL